MKPKNKKQTPTQPLPPKPTTKKLLETIDFSIIRNYFLYSLSPRGIKATISRRVTIELQKEKDGGLGALLSNPMSLLMLILALVVIATVVYPAVSSQAPIAACQQELTACIAATKSGLGIS